MFNNTLRNSICIPQFNFTKPIVFIENNDLPFDHIIKDKMEKFAQENKLELFKTKSIDEFASVAKELFNMNSDDALTLHNYVFDENYNHLDCDTVLNKYFKNFNLLELKSN